MSASSSTVMLQNISNRSPTRRAAASSSCPSPLSLDKDTTETPAILNLDKSDSLDGTLFFDEKFEGVALSGGLRAYF